MILIADSGSTKTDWCVVREGRPVRRFETDGTNPFFQAPEHLNSPDCWQEFSPSGLQKLHRFRFESPQNGCHL